MAMQTALKGLRLSATTNVLAKRTVANWNKPIAAASGTQCPADTQRNIHLTSSQDYPQVALLPLPENIDPNETIQFSPHRTREMSQAINDCHQVSLATGSYDNVNRELAAAAISDPHMGAYDAHGAVNLNCMMQSMVPEPFGGGHKFSHLNMPGGQWAQNGKFMAQDMQASHYTNLRQQVRSDWDKKGPYVMAKRSFHQHCLSLAFPTNTQHKVRMFSMAPQKENKTEQKVVEEKQSEAAASATETKADVAGQDKKSKLKQAFKEYGSTIVIFHVTISLASLGMFYALVSSGLDVVAIVNYFNMGDSVLASKVGTGASTFVIAYAVHKVFAPVRISITLGATPFLVRLMRKRGILKKSS